MGKLVVTLAVLFFAQISFAQSAIPRQCYNIPTNDTNAPVLYVNEQGQVNCVNYGGRKIVEYIYNDGQDPIDLAGSKRGPGALVAKRYYNFETKPWPQRNLRGLPSYLQPNVDNWDLVTPGSEYFSLGIVSEESLKFSKVKKLPDVIAEYFHDEKKADKFLETFMKEYAQLAGCKLPKNTKKLSCQQKLKFLQNPIGQQPEEIDAQQVNAQQTTHLFGLNTEMKDEIIKNIHQKAARNMSLSECNPDISSGIEQVIKMDRYYQPSDDELINLANTKIVDGKMRFFLSPSLFTDFGQLTLTEAQQQMNVYYPQSLQKFFKNKSPLDFNEKSNQYKDLSLLSWVLVRELGHSLMLNWMVDHKEQIDEMMLDVAAVISSPDLFKNVPEDLKTKINNEVVAPFTQIAESTAENFMIDSIPCIL